MAICVSLGLAVAGSAGLLIGGMHGRAVADVEQSLTGLSAVLADQADRALQAMELAQEAVIDEFKDAGVSNSEGFAAIATRQSLHDVLRTRIASLPQVNAITIVDSGGKLLNFSRYWPIPDVNISDRDYFQALSRDHDLKRFISRPVRNRGDGNWTIYVARKVSAPDGTFLGLVLGALELGYFEHLYRQIAPRDDYVVSIFRKDGMLLVRHPSQEGAIGGFFPTAGALLIASTNPEGGVLRTVSPIDRQDRLISSRALTRYPLILSISRTVRASLAAFYQQAVIIVAATILFDLCLVGLAVVLVRQARSHRLLAQAEADRVAAEERGKGERVLREQYARFGVALDNMIQGLCLFDAEQRLVVMNARFAELYAMPADLQRRGAQAEDIRHHIETRQGLSRSVIAAPPPGSAADACSSICDLADGRAISVVRAHVPGGGWVCTHEDVTERRRTEERMRFLARHDALTALPNRVLFEEVVGHELVSSANSDSAVALLCLDLDGFKQINDLFGHTAGDELLIEVAKRLQGVLGERCVAARLGGDEFAVLATGLGCYKTPDTAARAVIEALAVPFSYHGNRIDVGCSVGIATFPRDGVTYTQLLSAADMALGRAKRENKGTYCFFEPAMDAAARDRHTLAQDLRAALGAGQLTLHYQPQFKVATGRASGFEALLRWTHPERGSIAPNVFVAIAEETGLILPIGEWVLREACRTAAGWDRPLGIAVNLSIAQFRQADFLDTVQDILRETGLAPERLELEVTESLFLESTTRSQFVLRKLKALGVRISMDDFGTGYSSLLTLQSFPFDKLKIDRSFVQQIGVTEKGSAIVRAIISLGQSLNMSVIAEGIETEEQLAFLRQQHCAEMQGFLRGRPRAIEDYRFLWGESEVLLLRRA